MGDAICGFPGRIELCVDNRPYLTLSSRVIWSSPWYALREDRVRFPDGSNGPYTVIDKREAVWIVPVMKDGCFVLIRNYRHTVDDWLWEVPAGGIEAGHSPESTARQELAEEIGGTAQHLREVTAMFTMPGIGNERAHIFLAQDVVLGDPHHEPSEIMERHIVPHSQVVEMIYRGDIQDGPSALAILLCLPHLDAAAS
jgi:ADP-ribose pyrophosphatase